MSSLDKLDTDYKVVKADLIAYFLRRLKLSRPSSKKGIDEAANRKKKGKSSQSASRQ